MAEVGRPLGVVGGIREHRREGGGGEAEDAGGERRGPEGEAARRDRAGGEEAWSPAQQGEAERGAGRVEDQIAEARITAGDELLGELDAQRKRGPSEDGASWADAERGEAEAEGREENDVGQDVGQALRAADEAEQRRRLRILVR